MEEVEGGKVQQRMMSIICLVISLSGCGAARNAINDSPGFMVPVLEVNDHRALFVGDSDEAHVFAPQGKVPDPDIGREDSHG
jgi:hypothetical protein